jgi:hypothetical protein
MNQQKGSKIIIYLFIGGIIFFLYLLSTIVTQLQSSTFSTDSRAASSSVRSQNGTQQETRTQATVQNQETGEPPRDATCPTKWMMHGADRLDGTKTNCLAYCPNGKKKSARFNPGGYTAQKCQAEAQRLCGCTQPEACRAKVEFFENLKISCSGNDVSRLKITCPATGNSYSYLDEPRCYTREELQAIGTRHCCEPDAFTRDMDAQGCVEHSMPNSERGTAYRISCGEYAQRIGKTCDCSIQDGKSFCCVK